MEKTPRKKFQTLEHIINQECIPALDILCKIHKGEEETNNFSDKLTIERALKCLLCTRMANLFEDKDGRGINISGLKKIKRDTPIIKKMIDTRHTWFQHINANAKDIVSSEEICESNLMDQLKNLSIRLFSPFYEEVAVLEGLEAVKKGRVSKVFNNAKDAVKFLEKQ